MKKIIACVFLAFLAFFAGCSSDNSSSVSSASTDSTNKDYHVTFKYAASLNGKTGEVSNYTIIAKLDFEFKGNNMVNYCSSVGGEGNCELLAYTMEIDDGDEVYTMSRKGGNVMIEFVPKADDMDGPALLTIDYSSKIVAIWTKTEADLEKSLEVFEDWLTESDN